MTTAARWASRYRCHDEAGMADRSSCPHRSPNRVPMKRKRRIISVRVNLRWGPDRIGYCLGIHPPLPTACFRAMRWRDSNSRTGPTAAPSAATNTNIPAIWSMSISRSRDASPTAAGTRSWAGQRENATSPAPKPTPALLHVPAQRHR
ncbi:hypothetical protein HGO92_12595 [Arthrobacter sp. SF27]|nr:hypothetical protein [Arthrobacter sp. SF27]